VFVADEQGDDGEACPVDAPRWIRLVEAVLAAEGVRGEAEVSVRFVGPLAMADLNGRFMAASGPTDVLSFPIDGELIEPGRWPDGGTVAPDREPPDDDEIPLLLGDVVVCPSVAAANAPDHAGSYDDEIALLLVHGVLHLLGRDHAEAADRTAMQSRERELLDRFHGPLARDPWQAGADGPGGAG
jgi:probable rRNA maturation factor